MNIARSLDKPNVPRSKKRRRARRLKFTFRLCVLLVGLVSAGLAVYWTTVGIGMLWHGWGSPAVTATWSWLLQLSPTERFMWLNRLGWGSAGIGILTSLWVYARGSRFAKWSALICFTYSYAFLWYALWLALQSFFDVEGWTVNGLIGLTVIGYVYFVGRACLPRTARYSEETN